MVDLFHSLYKIITVWVTRPCQCLFDLHRTLSSSPACLIIATHMVSNIWCWEAPDRRPYVLQRMCISVSSLIVLLFTVTRKHELSVDSNYLDEVPTKWRHLLYVLLLEMQQSQFGSRNTKLGGEGVKSLYLCMLS